MNQTNTEELHFSIGSGGQKTSLENKDFEGKVIHPKYYKESNECCTFEVLEQNGTKKLMNIKTEEIVNFGIKVYF